MPMNSYDLYTGRLVQVRFSDTGQKETVRVEKMKIKKCTVMRQDGRRWDFYPTSIEPAPEGATFDLKVAEATGVTLGTAVRFKGTSTPGVFVCIGLQQGNTYKLAALGGNNGRYYHNVPTTDVEVMSLADVKAYLAYVS